LQNYIKNFIIKISRLKKSFQYVENSHQVDKFIFLIYNDNQY